MTRDEPPTLVLYDNEAHVKTNHPIRPDELVRVIRGNGPREGELMGWARLIPTANGGLVMDFLGLDPGQT